MSMSPEQLFRLLADATRLRCVVLLVQEGELCVCELAHALDLVQPKVSRHLALMREAGLVEDRREGQWVFYRIDPGLPAWARQALDAAVAGAGAGRVCRVDQKRLAAMPNRPGRRCCA